MNTYTDPEKARRYEHNGVVDPVHALSMPDLDIDPRSSGLVRRGIKSYPPDGVRYVMGLLRDGTEYWEIRYFAQWQIHDRASMALTLRRARQALRAAAA